MTDRDRDSTIEGLQDQPRGTGGRWAQRTAVALLTAWVIAGATGLLGPSTAEVSADSGGYRLAVEHPRVTRGGAHAPLHVRISSSEPFAGPVRLSLCDSWFDDFDFHTWYPAPAAETAEPGSLLYEFDPPPGDVLEVSLDAQAGHGELGSIDECEIRLLEGETPVASVRFTTWRMP